MTAQTFEQKRAKHALDRIKALQKEKAGAYVSYVNALPAAILMNGLGQALATELAAGGAHRQLAIDVSKWLLCDEAHSKYKDAAEGERAEYDDAQRLIGRIVAGEQKAYLRAQAEAIAYVTWLKKFANAFLESPERE